MNAPRQPSEGWIHEYPLRVQFEDVDQYGIVHHPRYLLFMERARVDLMGRIGMRADNLGGEHLGLIVVKAEVRFLRSARFLDELVVEQGCSKAGASRILLDYLLTRGGEKICQAQLTLAFVDRTGRPVRAPADIKAELVRLGVPG